MRKKIAIYILCAAVLLSCRDLLFADTHMNITDLLKMFGKKGRIVTVFKSEVQAKEYLVKKAKGTRMPSLDADLSYTWLDKEPEAKTPGGSFPTQQDAFWKGQMVLSYLIYDFGQRESLVERAVLDRELSGYYLKKEVNEQGFILANIFYQLLTVKKMRESFEEELKALQEHKKKADLFYEEGLITRNEVLQINVEISNTKQKILRAMNDIASLRERLRLLVNSDEYIEPVDDSGSVLPPASEGSFVYDKRPELLIAGKLVMMKDHELQETKSGYYPKLYTSTGVNYEENRYRTSDHSMFLSIGVKMNLFEGGRTKNEELSIVSAKIEQEEKVNQVKDMIHIDVVNAVNDHKTAVNRIEAAKDALNQAQENLRIQQNKYDEHLIAVTELIDATLLVTRTNLNYYQALYDAKIAYYRTLWAQGLLYGMAEE